MLVSFEASSEWRYLVCNKTVDTTLLLLCIALTNCVSPRYNRQVGWALNNQLSIYLAILLLPDRYIYSTFILLSVKYMLGMFVFSVIHRTLTWTRGSFASAHVCDHCYAFLYTRGLGTPTAQHFYSKKTPQFFLVLLTGFKPLVIESLSPTLYQLSHPVTPYANLILEPDINLILDPCINPRLDWSGC